MDRLPSALRRILALPLPGLDAQLRMAPRLRDGPEPRVPHDGLRHAAALLLLYPHDGQWHVPLTLRGASLRHHTGQMSLPGGRLDQGESVEAAALREAREEIGVVPADVDVLGLLTPLPIAVSGHLLHPVVGVSARRPVFALAEHEVEALVEVPLTELQRAEAVQWEVRQRGRPPYGEMDVPGFDVGGVRVWGATAMVLAEFLAGPRGGRAYLTTVEVSRILRRMTRHLSFAALGALLVLAAGCRDATRVAEAPGVSSPAGAIPQRTKEQHAALGRQHKTAWDLYQALKAEAKGGQTLAASMMPDWSGVYSRPADKGFTFDPDLPAGVLTTAKLTPEYQAKLETRVADVKRGIEWDPISTCAPPGHPRWLTEPFLREFVPTPTQTWLINEMVNDIRRVYTDGRDHVPAEDRYPLYNGDSIGFWDGGRLVVHTNQLQGGIYQRSNPDYTDQVETVEIWQREGDTIIADVWVYDPPALAEPWYVKQVYGKLDPKQDLRIRYWNCAENQNNAVHQTQDGTTQFNGFTFDPKAATK